MTLEYVITFLEGLISFISPCMLPMLPMYITYFAGDADKKEHIALRAGAFIFGFTIVFSLLGLFAGTLGGLLGRYQTIVNIICGGIVILFGLGYLDIIHLNFFKGVSGRRSASDVLSAFLFGLIYSVSLTPCVGAFLGSAIMLASTTGGAVKGLLLLLCYSLGLGIPFLLSAILIDKLTVVFTVIKKHYRIINLISGLFLILMGLMMITGLLNSFLGLFQ